MKQARALRTNSAFHEHFLSMLRDEILTWHLQFERIICMLAKLFHYYFLCSFEGYFKHGSICLEHILLR